MSKKVDIRLLLYQVFNMHKLVLDCIKKNLYDDAYLLLSFEFKKYEYIRDNLKKKIKISSYYLEYSTTIDTKINDIKYALNFVNKKIQDTSPLTVNYTTNRRMMQDFVVFWHIN